MSLGEWSVPAAAGAWLVARRAAAVVIVITGSVLALAGAVGIGLWLGTARSSFGVWIVLMFGTVWLARALWSRPPREMAAAKVAVPERGRLAIDGDVVAIRSCRYDGAEGLLWARGPLGAPLACVRAREELACEIVDALGRPERGLRTIAATPPMVAIPVVGFFLAVALGFALVFGLTMLIAGPPRIGVPAAAITVSLSVLLLRPARVQLGVERLEWSWWSFRRAIPLVTIERVVATAESLRIETTDGRTRKLKVRTMGNGAGGTSLLESMAVDRLASYAAFIERAADATRPQEAERAQPAQ